MSGDYLKVIKKIPTEYLFEWLGRHEELKDTEQYKDYAAELELRNNER